jgi:uncharacterized protein YndB with AHSA1/START domain
MTDTNHETAEIERQVRIVAPIETVWRQWTDPERMAKWWGAAELSPSPGGIFKVKMEGGQVMSGTYLALEPPHRLVFSFGWEGNEPGEPMAPGSTTVEVSLSEDGDHTVLVLRHRDVPLGYEDDHGQGWSTFLAVLAKLPLSA